MVCEKWLQWLRQGNTWDILQEWQPHIYMEPHSEMLGFFNAVQGSQSVSWQVIIHFYLRDCCKLISNFFLSLLLLRSLSLSNYPELIFNSKKAQSGHFQVVDSVCWEPNRAWTFSWLKAGFWLWTPVSWSIFWSNSSSETPQRCTSWTLHSSMVQEQTSLITKCKAAYEHTFSPLTDIRSRRRMGYSIKGTPYTGFKRQAVPDPCVMCLFCKCNYRCCKTSEISCLKITWHNQDSTRWGFWFIFAWEKGRNIKMIAHTLENL